MSLPDAGWPWLAVAGLGVLHGLSPANGWLFAAARATRSGDTRDVRRALLPIALGHAVSVALVVALVMLGLWQAADRLYPLAGAGLLALAAWRRRRRSLPRVAHRSHASLAAWSCVMGTAHGSGLMLVPALLPLCMANGPARAITATGSLLLMLAAVAVHLLAMLATTQVIAGSLCRGLQHRAFPTEAARTLLLALTGVLLIALH
ncbi:hypothetical protein [Pseudoxanthomonas mexicana]